mmetsp:Transcript_32950/g.101792  ORF Transcript_32950/g.101792 Transcript_32950/m.101792 type:complete len:388 (-) Transcript_32950:212-1375(-)
MKVSLTMPCTDGTSRSWYTRERPEVCSDMRKEARRSSNGVSAGCASRCARKSRTIRATSPSTSCVKCFVASTGRRGGSSRFGIMSEGCRSGRGRPCGRRVTGLCAERATLANVLLAKYGCGSLGSSSSVSAAGAVPLVFLGAAFLAALPPFSSSLPPSPTTGASGTSSSRARLPGSLSALRLTSILATNLASCVSSQSAGAPARTTRRNVSVSGVRVSTCSSNAESCERDSGKRATHRGGAAVSGAIGFTTSGGGGGAAAAPFFGAGLLSFLPVSSFTSVSTSGPRTHSTAGGAPEGTGFSPSAPLPVVRPVSGGVAVSSSAAPSLGRGGSGAADGTSGSSASSSSRFGTTGGSFAAATKSVYMGIVCSTRPFLNVCVTPATSTSTS